MIVVDTNIISYFYIYGEYSDFAEKAFKKDSHWAAPLLWRSEFRNVAARYLRKKLISLADALEIVEEAELLMKGNEYSVSSFHTLQLVDQSECSAYDCEFVALARDLKIRLITMDKKILENFPTTTLRLGHFIEY
jgi:predicted nucleic acid-binding protein